MARRQPVGRTDDGRRPLCVRDAAVRHFSLPTHLREECAKDCRMSTTSSSKDESQGSIVKRLR